MSAGASNADVLAREFILVRPSRHWWSNVDRADPNVRILLGEMARREGFERSLMLSLAGLFEGSYREP